MLTPADQALSKAIHSELMPQKIDLILQDFNIVFEPIIWFIGAYVASLLTDRPYPITLEIAIALSLFITMFLFEICFWILFFLAHRFRIWCAVCYSLIHFCVLLTSLVKRSASRVGFFFMCHTGRWSFFFIFLFHTINLKMECIKHAKWCNGAYESKKLLLIKCLHLFPTRNHK